VESGATLTNAVISGIAKEGDGTGGLLIVQSGAVLTGITIGWKGRIDVDTLNWTDGQRIIYGNNTISIVDAAGNIVWSADVRGMKGNSATDYHLERDPVDGSTVIVYDKCFLKGTMIRTDRGEVPVEDLVVGDRVAAFVDGVEVMREIIWTGRRSTSVRPNLPEDEAGYPVRILANALGENVPHKDLLVTPEHAMYLDGAFVPARMLVNGRSIFYDHSITQFDFYHIETDAHSILWSDGALSESYLDTGDRDLFYQGSPVVHLLNAPARDWAEHGAAPLRTEREFVEPIHASLVARADALGCDTASSEVLTTDEPDLHLVDQDGHVIRAIRKVNRSYVFMVPATASALRLVSRVARPVDMIGAFVDDRRHLGVLVGEIQVWEAGETRQITAHLGEEAVSGWARLAEGAKRWTTGNALLPLATVQTGDAAMLSIEVLAGGPYPIKDTLVAPKVIAG